MDKQRLNELAGLTEKIDPNVEIGALSAELLEEARDLSSLCERALKELDSFDGSHMKVSAAQKIRYANFKKIKKNVDRIHKILNYKF